MFIKDAQQKSLQTPKKPHSGGNADAEIQVRCPSVENTELWKVLNTKIKVSLCWEHRAVKGSPHKN